MISFSVNTDQGIVLKSQGCCKLVGFYSIQKVPEKTSTSMMSFWQLLDSILKTRVKIFLEPAMFCHLAVLILLAGEGKVKDPMYMQNKKDSRISLHLAA